MKTKTTNFTNFFLLTSIVLALFSCSIDRIENSENSATTATKEETKASKVTQSVVTVTYTDEAIAQEYAPQFLQDVDTTDGLCSNQSKSGSADWIAAVDYDGDWDTSNNWDNMVSGRNSGQLAPYIYYYVTYTETHFFILYSVYHPRDWTDILFLCSLDSHENDMEAVLITAERNADGNFGSIINAQTIWHSDVYDYTNSELLIISNTNTSKFFIEAKGHGIRKMNGSSDKDGSYIEYYYDGAPAVTPDKDSDNLPQTVHYNLLALESTLWLQRNNPLTVTGTALVGNNGDGSNKASTPWGWENGVLCKNPAQYLKDKYSWTNFSTNYISDTPIQ